MLCFRGKGEVAGPSSKAGSPEACILKINVLKEGGGERVRVRAGSEKRVRGIRSAHDAYGEDGASRHKRPCCQGQRKRRHSLHFERGRGGPRKGLGDHGAITERLAYSGKGQVTCREKTCHVV